MIAFGGAIDGPKGSIQVSLLLLSFMVDIFLWLISASTTCVNVKKVESLEACALACTKESDCTTFFYKVLFVIIYQCMQLLRNRNRIPVIWERRQNYKKRVAWQAGGVLKVVFNTLEMLATYKFIKIPELFCQVLCSILMLAAYLALLSTLYLCDALQGETYWRNILWKCLRNTSSVSTLSFPQDWQSLPVPCEGGWKSPLGLCWSWRHPCL